jgi:hypothetical protein
MDSILGLVNDVIRSQWNYYQRYSISRIRQSAICLSPSTHIEKTAGLTIEIATGMKARPDH